MFSFNKGKSIIKKKIPLIFASSTSVYGDQFKVINSKKVTIENFGDGARDSLD